MIRFPRDLYDAVVDHAMQENAVEVCGILGGTFGPDRSTVASVHPAENVAETPSVRYHIDPEEQLQLTERIEEAGQEVVGFYHSHPAGPPGPSQTDAERATWPGRSYVIVALGGRAFVGSWRWRDDGGFTPERVELAAAR